MNQTENKYKDLSFLYSKRFNNKLINSLPGIFYLYEKIGDEYFLKRWNDNYETDLGYPKESILNMQPHQFFTKKEYKKVEKAIMQIFNTGTVQVEIYTTHKNGQQIPYYYEGYQFEDKGRKFFMGVGIDISSRYALEKKNKREHKKKLKAKERLNANKRELITTAIQNNRTNKIVETTLKRIDKILEEQKGIEIFNELSYIRKNLDLQISQKDDWEIFKLQFTKVHKQFFKKLKEKHPSLTKSELKFCAFLRINLSSHQISSVLNITKESINKIRYRVRKKLNLSTKDSLEDYIANF